jgi:carbamoyltransferase
MFAMSLKEGWSRMTRYILGLNPGFGGFNYHDPAACILADGRLVAAAEEERFVRRKGAPGLFPDNAVRACLDTTGICIGDIACIAVGYSPEAWQQRLSLEAMQVGFGVQSISYHARRRERVKSIASAQASLVDTGLGFLDIVRRSLLFRDNQRAAERIHARLGEASHVPIRFVEHHLAHAASAFYPSGFKEAAVIVADGVGEIETVSIWAGDHQGLRRIASDILPNSLGYFYAAITEFLGFRGFEGEGKTMALASYGTGTTRALEMLLRYVNVDDRCFDASVFVADLLGPELLLDLPAAVARLHEILGVPPREKHDPMEPIHTDIACAAQTILERAISALARRAVGEVGVHNLCFAGGIALNCKLNLVLRELNFVDALFAQPVASDAGVSFGAALQVARELGDDVMHAMPNLCLGPQPHDDFSNDLKRWGISYSEPKQLAQVTAHAIDEGRIVMWYQGCAEFGPRALGARSILVDPRRIDLRDRLNALVKRRESWRPFGPAILEAHAGEVLEGFKATDRAPYMIQAYRMKREWCQRVPGVVHVDGTTRPQTVSSTEQPLYAAVIDAFFRSTGIPMVTNTSFNDLDEPIVQTTRDAVRTFFTSAAEVLVLGPYWIEKSSIKPAAFDVPERSGEGAA